MKLIIDERAKHRIIGLAVFVSVCAIFIPALMKKSSERFERNISLSIALPPNPALPKVVVPAKTTVFEKVKVAQVAVPSVNSELKPVSTLAKATPLKPPVNSGMNIQLARIPDLKKDLPAPSHLAALNKVQTIPLKKAILNTKTAIKPVYSVQLAYFSKQKNAESLVHTLKNKGYNATYKKVISKNDTVFYRVLVGALSEKKKAFMLKDQLAQLVQLKGIIVPASEVS